VRALSNRRALLFFDGAEECDDLGSVLAVRGKCGVLVTTQRRSDAPGPSEEVFPLPKEKAIALLRAWAGDTVEEDAAGRICVAVDGLPLAVRLAGSYLGATGEDPDQYADWVEHAPLAVLHTGPHHHQSVRVLLSRSVGRVAKAAQDALCVVGCLAPSPFHARMVAAALDVPEGEARRALNELALYGLLTRAEARYAVTHRLVHAYAGECCPPPVAVLDRLAAFSTDLAGSLVPRGSEGFVALEPDRTHLVQIIRACAVHERWRGAFSLTWAAHDYLRYQGHLTELREALNLGLRGARALCDEKQEAKCIFWLGDVHRMLAEYDAARARYEEARPIYASIGARLGEANCIKSLGDVHLRVDEYDAARARYEEARTVFQSIGDRLGEANCIQSLGDVHLWVDEYDAARARYEEARTVFQSIGARHGLAATLAYLGLTHRGLGDTSRAREDLLEAVRLFHEIGSPDEELAQRWLAEMDDAPEETPTA